MTAKQVIKTLRTFNRWRRGADIAQPDPKEIGVAIDIAIAIVDRMQAKGELPDRIKLNHLIDRTDERD